MKISTRILQSLSLMFFVIFVLSACSQSEPQKKLDEVTVQLKWVHQAQFAGFYMAQEKGYYQEENLKVNFLPGGSGVDITGTILSSEADFGVVASEMVLIKRQQERAPITAIAAIYRRSATVYVAKKESGIIAPADFLDKTVAARAAGESAREYEYQLMAMMNKLGLDVTRIKIAPYDPQYVDFKSDKIKVTAAYLTGGVIRLRREGLGLNIIWPGDYGIQFYSDTLVTTEKMIKQQPELVKRFLRATLRGWREAIGNAEKAAEISLKYAKIKDLQYQLDMMNGLRPLVDTGQDHIGWMTISAWQKMHNILIEQGILTDRMLDFDNVCNTDFLGSIYSENGP